MQPRIRSLFEKVLEYQGLELIDDILTPWINATNYKEYLYSNKDLTIQQNNYELYALSRLLDLLTLSLQPNNNADGSSWNGFNINKDQYVKFANSIGLSVEEPVKFHSFNCEILAISEESNFNELICNYPTIKFNNIIIKKAGVILPHNSIYNLKLINNSTIYWAYRRKNRKFKDLSQGWGTNSQWNTELRIDFETETHYIYNSTGKLDLNNPNTKTINELKQQDLTIEEAIEIIKYRHFVECQKDDDDLFSYDFKYIEKKNKS